MRRLAPLLEAIRWALSAIEEKRDNGKRRLSMTRCAVAAFTVSYVIRLPGLEAPTWPDAFLGFVILFALGISKAIDRAPPEKVVDAVTGMFGRGGGTSGFAFRETTSTAVSGPAPLTIEDLAAPVSRGRPADDEEPGSS